MLLVEPDPVLAHTYTAALEGGGHEVMHAASAQAAIHVADSATPDVVVLEMQLPGHNGIEFLYEFRSYADWQEVPVILLTGLPASNPGLDTTLWHELGVKQYLYKPTTKLRRLVQCVESVLAPASQ